MFYLLIGLYVYKKTNNEEFVEYVEKLKFTIGDINFKNFDKYIEQMK